WFHDEGVRAAPGRELDVRRLRECRHDSDRDAAHLRPLTMLPVREQIETDTVGETTVEDHHLRPARLHPRPRLGDRTGGLDAVALVRERRLIDDARIGIVLDDEDAKGTFFGEPST